MLSLLPKVHLMLLETSMKKILTKHKLKLPFCLTKKGNQGERGANGLPGIPGNEGPIGPKGHSGEPGLIIFFCFDFFQSLSCLYTFFASHISNTIYTCFILEF